MVPELSKAAMGLNPLIGTYAVDCDDEKNKNFCSQQVSVARFRDGVLHLFLTPPQSLL